MIIAEPATMVTDYALAAVGAFFSARLFRRARSGRPVKLWAMAFALLSLAAVAGGTYHGFAPMLTTGMLAVVWTSSTYLVGLFDLFIVAGSILASLAGRFRAWLLVAAGLKFLVFAAWMTSHDDFVYVLFDSAGAMTLLLLLHGYSACLHRDEASRWIVAAVLVSALAAAVQVSGFALHRHFNHNDLYHVIQAIALALLYQGGRRLRERLV